MHVCGANLLALKKLRFAARLALDDELRRATRIGYAGTMYQPFRNQLLNAIPAPGGEEAAGRHIRQGP